MDKYMNTNNVYLDKSELGGFGVFARKKILKGELVEKGIMMPLVNTDGNDNPHLFTWSDDRKVWASGSGYFAFYNHSDIPNIVKKGDLENNTMDIFALRDIEKGEELYNTYFSKKWRECFQEF